MSRHLPAYPSLEHLKKQAKDLLPNLRRRMPHARLADAQHAIALEYGFASWPILKAHVESLAAAANPVEAPLMEHSLVGIWTADVSKSTPHPDNPFSSATLQFAVARDAVTITDVLVDASGREARGTNTLQADGNEYPHEHGYAVTARWLGSRVLEAVVKKDGRLEGRVTYEISPDGRTLTVSAGQQVAVFNRGEPSRSPRARRSPCPTTSPPASASRRTTSR